MLWWRVEWVLLIVQMMIAVPVFCCPAYDTVLYCTVRFTPPCSCVKWCVSLAYRPASDAGAALLIITSIFRLKGVFVVLCRESVRIKCGPKVGPGGGGGGDFTEWTQRLRAGEWRVRCCRFFSWLFFGTLLVFL